MSRDQDPFGPAMRTAQQGLPTTSTSPTGCCARGRADATDFANRFAHTALIDIADALAPR